MSVTYCQYDHGNEQNEPEDGDDDANDHAGMDALALSAAGAAPTPRTLIFLILFQLPAARTRLNQVFIVLVDVAISLHAHNATGPER